MNPPKPKETKRLLILKGIAMGAANKVPGVSGGIVAFVFGFYEEFIYSFQKYFLIKRFAYMNMKVTQLKIVIFY